MAEELTSGQVVARNVEALGEELGLLYTDLYNECIWVHTIWREVDSLYGTSQERVDLLNRTASYFFYLLQLMAQDNVLLHIARITDPPGSGDKRNITVRSLPQHISDPKDASRVQEKVEALLGAASFAREHRNKRIAHIDLAARRGTIPEPLPAATRERIENVLGHLREVLNEFERCCLQFSVHYEDGVAPMAGADSLARYLAAGSHFLEDWYRRLKSGEADPKERSIWSI